jgi:hypothetical protein
MNRTRTRTALRAAAAAAFVPATLLLAGCASTPAPVARPAAATQADPQAQFMARLSALCGRAFAGRIVASAPAGADADMAGQALVMHIRRCTPDRIEIPFHVGTDRSRTWIITRESSGLRLKHDHRHADGSADAVTMYGGDTASRGSAERQEFPVDAMSIANFRSNGLARSVANVWAMELSAAGDAAPRFTYELRRPAGENARLFRVEFDLSRDVPVPPTPWGW